MIYKALFDKASQKIVRAGVIGTGTYAKAIVTQAMAISRLEIPVIADIEVEAALNAYQLAGVTRQDIVIAENHTTAIEALEQNKRVVTQDPLLLMDLPLDVIVESTGVAEVGARNALSAIQHYKHVVMVSKETDVTVGPILKQLAAEAGVVYTAADGDQHGLLIALVDWCRELGLELLCAGKFIETKLFLNRERNKIIYGTKQISVTAADLALFNPFPMGPYKKVVERRRAVLGDALQVRNSEMTELTIVANATGTVPERERLHHPALWPAEIPSILCPAEAGGILDGRGAVEIANNLRLADGLSLAGGVFTVVACTNEYSRQMMQQKRHPANKDGSAFLISRPYHLCGVETPISILSAGLLGVPTSGQSFRQLFDVVARTTQPLTAGTIVGDDHDVAFETLMRPAQSKLEKGTPVPFHMASGHALNRDLPADTIVTCDMIDVAEDNPLWQLRQQQDNIR